MAEKLYKVLGHNGESVNGGACIWNRHGKWMPAIEGELVPCENGYHLCRAEDLLEWFGPTIWEATYRGDRLDDDNKVVVRQPRLLRKMRNWDETVARLFAVDCAERAMFLGDEVLISCVLAVAYLFAIGEATQEQLTAARDAAWEAAWEAAETAAGDAARIAARAVAKDEAWEAASTAAGDAAGEVARAAAWAAARDATWAIARAATRGAASTAVGDAAGEAAWDAEKEWQTNRLMEYIGGYND